MLGGLYANMRHICILYLLTCVRCVAFGLANTVTLSWSQVPRKGTLNFIIIFYCVACCSNFLVRSDMCQSDHQSINMKQHIIHQYRMSHQEATIHWKGNFLLEICRFPTYIPKKYASGWAVRDTLCCSRAA